MRVARPIFYLSSSGRIMDQTRPEMMRAASDSTRHLETVMSIRSDASHS